MHPTFRQLQIFLALADSGSVTAAARLAHVTQPTASMALAELTRAVGVPLYEVVARRVRLTDVGLELARTARSISQNWESFVQDVGRRRGLTQGRLRIAVVSTAAYFMPRLIGGFCRKHPQIEISLEVLNRDGVVQRLRDNVDELYIMSMPPTDLELHDAAFMENPIVVIAAADDPLLRGGAKPLSALAQRQFILRERGSGTRMAVDRHFRRARFRANVRLELGSNEALREAVAGGLGLGLVSRHALRDSPRRDGVGVLDVRGFPINSKWHLVHPARRRLSPLAQAFQDELLRAAP